MTTVTAEEFFGGQVPPPPADTTIHTPQTPSLKSTVHDLSGGFLKGVTQTLQSADALTGANFLAGAKTDWTGMTPEQRQAVVTPSNPTEAKGKLAEFGLEIAGPAALKGISAATKAVKSGEVIGSAVKNIKNIRFALTNLDPQTETILKQTSLPDFEKYYGAAEKAAVDPRAATPMEVAGEQAKTALDQIQRKLSAIGSQKSAVMQSAAGRTPVGNVVVKFRQNLANSLKSKTAVEGDTKLIRDITDEAQKLGNNPSAADVDRFVDFVQDRIYTARRDLTVPVTDSTTGSIRKLTGQLNEALKSKLPTSYRNLNDQYSSLVDVRNELNTKLGPEGERGGALLKRVFSPSDANTKQLFEQVRKITGVDLVKDASLAKFVMESVGDVRQKSLLKQLDVLTNEASQVDLSKPGTWLQYLRDKADLSPDKAAREIIKRSGAQATQ